MPVQAYLVQSIQQYYGQTISMSWNYIDLTNGARGDENALALHWRGEIGPLLNDLQTEQVTNVGVYCLNLTNGADSITIDWSGQGAGTLGAAKDLPPFLTATARLRVDLDQMYPTRPLIKRGYVRVSGLNDDNIEGGVNLVDGYKDAFEDMLTAMRDPVAVSTANYVWSVNRRPQPDNDPPIQEQWATIIGTASFKVGTQNTRK